jgi:hypothetical protein
MIGGCYGSSHSGWLRLNCDGSATFSNGASLTAGGTFQNNSDRNLKENFTVLDSQDILNKINSLPITEWDYISEGASVKHIGPIAQDFYSTFNVGNSSTSISTIDPAGIALVGIQALSQRLDLLEGSTTFASMTIPYDSLTSTSTSVFSTLESFGAEVVDGIAYLKDVWVEKLHVGTSDKPSGITIYDIKTKQPMCVVSEDGTLKEIPGDCDTAIQSETNSNVSVISAPGATSSSDDNNIIATSTSATSSPDVSTSTPDSASSTVATSTSATSSSETSSQSDASSTASSSTA